MSEEVLPLVLSQVSQGPVRGGTQERASDRRITAARAFVDLLVLQVSCCSTYTAHGFVYVHVHVFALGVACVPGDATPMLHSLRVYVTFLLAESFLCQAESAPSFPGLNSAAPTQAVRGTPHPHTAHTGHTGHTCTTHPRCAVPPSTHRQVSAGLDTRKGTRSGQSAC